MAVACVACVTCVTCGRDLWPYRCELVAALTQELQLLQEMCVPPCIITALMQQVMAFINCQLFNQLLLRPDCCCSSTAAYLLAGGGLGVGGEAGLG